MTFQNLRTAAELEAFNNHLSEWTYVGKAKPTSEDSDAYAKIQKIKATKLKDYVAITRWVKHMASFTTYETKSWTVVRKEKSATPAKKASTPKKDKKQVKKDIKDDE